MQAGRDEFRPGGARRRWPRLAPVLGWGLGRYPSAQWAWTHVGRPLSPTQRPSLSEEAHDFYLQTLVETGAIGLTLYLAALVTLAGQCVRALHRHGTRPYGLRQALLIATLSLVFGQGVDALASPSWQFPEVSLLFWASLGLGLAATRTQQSVKTPADLSVPYGRPLRLATTGAAAVIAVAQFLPLGLLLPAMATYNPPNTADTYVPNSAYLSGPTAAAAGATVDYRIMAMYNNTVKGNYLVNATGDSQSNFAAAQVLTPVGSYTIDRVGQVIHYTLPSSVPSGGKNITLSGSFRDAKNNKDNTAAFTVTMQ